MRLLWKGRDFQQYPRIEWCVNNVLQLQRLAHEQMGYGKWKGCDEAVPFLEEDATLAPLDLEDPKHPRLKAQIDGKESERMNDAKDSRAP